MHTITHCEKCIEFLRDFGTVADIYVAICDLFLKKFAQKEHLVLIYGEKGDLIIDFLEKKGYVLTHEIPDDSTSFIVKPCGLWMKGEDFYICTCDCPIQWRKIGINE